MIDLLATMRVDDDHFNIVTLQERGHLSRERRVSKHDGAFDERTGRLIVDETGVACDRLAAEAHPAHYLGEQGQARGVGKRLCLEACALARDHHSEGVALVQVARCVGDRVAARSGFASASGTAGRNASVAVSSGGPEHLARQLRQALGRARERLPKLQVQLHGAGRQVCPRSSSGTHRTRGDRCRIVQADCSCRCFERLIDVNVEREPRALGEQTRLPCRLIASRASQRRWSVCGQQQHRHP